MSVTSVRLKLQASPRASHEGFDSLICNDYIMSADMGTGAGKQFLVLARYHKSIYKILSKMETDGTIFIVPIRDVMSTKKLTRISKCQKTIQRNTNLATSPSVQSHLSTSL